MFKKLKRLFGLQSYTLIEKAKKFSIQAHNSIGHKRKYSDEPYHRHCARVAQLVASVTTDESIIAAAWLHDVIEDVAPKNANYGAKKIEALFGKHILQLILEVSDISKPSDGNRAKRKAIDHAHLVQASPEGKTIKLADLIDNLIDITQHDANFAKIFRKEMLLILPYLESGNPILFERLKQLLAEGVPKN